MDTTHRGSCPVEDAVTELDGTFTVSPDALNTLMDGLAPLYNSLLTNPRVGDHPGAATTRAGAILSLTAHVVQHVEARFGDHLADNLQRVIAARYGVDLLATAKSTVRDHLRAQLTSFLDDLINGGGA